MVLYLILNGCLAFCKCGDTTGRNFCIGEVIENIVLLWCKSYPDTSKTFLLVLGYLTLCSNQFDWIAFF